MLYQNKYSQLLCTKGRCYFMLHIENESKYMFEQPTSSSFLRDPLRTELIDFRNQFLYRPKKSTDLPCQLDMHLLNKIGYGYIFAFYLLL